jgi:hypothetical protein
MTKPKPLSPEQQRNQRAFGRVLAAQAAAYLRNKNMISADQANHVLRAAWDDAIENGMSFEQYKALREQNDGKGWEQIERFVRERPDGVSEEEHKANRDAATRKVTAQIAAEWWRSGHIPAAHAAAKIREVIDADEIARLAASDPAFRELVRADIAERGESEAEARLYTAAILNPNEPDIEYAAPKAQPKGELDVMTDRDMARHVLAGDLIPESRCTSDDARRALERHRVEKAAGLKLDHPMSVAKGTAGTVDQGGGSND